MKRQRISPKFIVGALARKTRDAYSCNRFADWSGCVKLLADRGYNENQAEAILRSKHMRWCADGSSKRYGKATVKDLAIYLDDPRNGLTDEHVAGLLTGTV